MNSPLQAVQCTEEYAHFLDTSAALLYTVHCNQANGLNIVEILLYLRVWSTEIFVRHFEVRHPSCVGSITKNFFFVYYTIQSNTTIISLNSTVGIQLHVSALHVGHLQVVI